MIKPCIQNITTTAFSNLVIVIHDISEERHEHKDLNAKQEVVLVCDTPDDRPLVLANPVQRDGQDRDIDLPSATASFTVHPAIMARTWQRFRHLKHELGRRLSMSSRWSVGSKCPTSDTGESQDVGDW